MWPVRALMLTLFDEDWLEEEMAARGIDHYDLDDDDMDGDLLMTAGPEKLRGLLGEALVIDGAMDEDTVVFTRSRQD